MVNPRGPTLADYARALQVRPPFFNTLRGGGIIFNCSIQTAENDPSRLNRRE